MKLPALTELLVHMQAQKVFYAASLLMALVLIKKRESRLVPFVAMVCKAAVSPELTGPEALSWTNYRTRFLQASPVTCSSGGEHTTLFFVGFYLHACVLSCVRLCDLVDCSPQGSSVQGVSQARILE